MNCTDHEASKNSGDTSFSPVSYLVFPHSRLSVIFGICAVYPGIVLFNHILLEVLLYANLDGKMNWLMKLQYLIKIKSCADWVKSRMGPLLGLKKVVLHSKQ